jgi:hypothetical protein
MNSVLREQLAHHLLHRFNVTIRPKGNAVEMEMLGRAFGVAQMLGLGVPNDEEFLTRWWTTLGPVLYTPLGRHLDVGEWLDLLGHEVTHVIQFWRDRAAFVMGYIGSSFERARYEAEAERARYEVIWLMHGEFRRPLDLDATRHGYAMSDSHANLTRDLLEQSVTSIASGIIATDVGLAVLAWMREHCPDQIKGYVANA